MTRALLLAGALFVSSTPSTLAAGSLGWTASVRLSSGDLAVDPDVAVPMGRSPARLSAAVRVPKPPKPGAASGRGVARHPEHHPMQFHRYRPDEHARKEEF